MELKQLITLADARSALATIGRNLDGWDGADNWNERQELTRFVKQIEELCRRLLILHPASEGSQDDSGTICHLATAMLGEDEQE